MELAKEVFPFRSLWKVEGEATSCHTHLWAFHTPGSYAEAKPSFGFLRLEQPTLLGSWWGIQDVLGKGKLLGHQGLRSGPPV